MKKAKDYKSKDNLPSHDFSLNSAPSLWRESWLQRSLTVLFLHLDGDDPKHGPIFNSEPSLG